MNRLKEFWKRHHELIEHVWRKVVVVILYVLVMWGLLVTAAYLYLKDFWQSAGIVSAIILFRIAQSEFYKEFFGARNPQVVNNAVQKQGKR